MLLSVLKKNAFSLIMLDFIFRGFRVGLFDKMPYADI
jgi:hypothetical protein